MATFRKVLHLQTQHEGDIIDLTGELRKTLGESSFKSGLACVFVPHSTAAIFAMEFEPGLRKDMREVLHRLIPKGIEYEHHKTWNDENGHSHVRSSFLGASITVPFHEGVPDLGTWQQVVLMELDNGGRERKVIIQLISA
jgi:secondary thiamine-phosphate synthase enzyme